MSPQEREALAKVALHGSKYVDAYETMLGLLEQIHDELLPYEDVVDDHYGEQGPNYAMRLVNDIERVLDAAEKAKR